MFGKLEPKVYDRKTIIESVNLVEDGRPKCPQGILDAQRIVIVEYLDMLGKKRTGNIIVHKEIVNDIKFFFRTAILYKFQIVLVEPVAFCKWNDLEAMNRNYTSGFNYRFIDGTKRLSLHAFGHAFDVNPNQNPVVYKDGTAIPKGATYTPGRAGVLKAQHPLVVEMKRLGWVWGGDFNDFKDYQHFEKPLAQ